MKLGSLPTTFLQTAVNFLIQFTVKAPALFLGGYVFYQQVVWFGPELGLPVLSYFSAVGVYATLNFASSQPWSDIPKVELYFGEAEEVEEVEETYYLEEGEIPEGLQEIREESPEPEKDTVREIVRDILTGIQSSLMGFFVAYLLGASIHQLTLVW